MQSIVKQISSQLSETNASTLGQPTEEVTAASQEIRVALWWHLRWLENKAGLLSTKGRCISVWQPSFPSTKDTKRNPYQRGRRLAKLRVLERQPASEWASPLFIIPKQNRNRTVCFLSIFWEVNKTLIRKPFPIPKVSMVLQELEKSTFATALDLNRSVLQEQRYQPVSWMVHSQMLEREKSRDAYWYASWFLGTRETGRCVLVRILIFGYEGNGNMFLFSKPPYLLTRIVNSGSQVGTRGN